MAVIDLTQVNDEELYIYVNDYVGYGENDYAAEKLKMLIRGVKNEMLGEGIPEKVVNSQSAVDVIAMSVDAILNNTEPLSYVQSKKTQLRMVDYE